MRVAHLEGGGAGPAAVAGAGAFRAGLAVMEWALLAVAAPLLLFPSWYTGAGAVLLAAGWVARRMLAGRWTQPSPAHRPALLLLAALGLSLVPSVHLGYSAPKFWGLVLGLATFYVCLNTCRSRRAARWAEGGMLAAGSLLAVVGAVGMSTPPQKVLPDQDVYALLPRIQTGIQTSTVVTAGIHPNEVAGALTLFVPLATAVALSGSRGGARRMLAAPAAGLMLAVLLLSQSRGAIIGTVVALAVGAIWWRGVRGVLLAGLGLGAVVAVGLAAMGPERLLRFAASDAPTAGTVSLAGRVELWQRSITMLLDMPVTGIGLNSFPVILQSFYPTVGHYDLQVIPHAHNLFLQTALDLGLAGLAAFLWLVALAVRGGLRAGRDALAGGLLLGLLAHGVYSLSDAVVLGAKPGPALWATLGLLVALGSGEGRALDGPEVRTASPGAAALAPNDGGRVRRLAVVMAVPVALVLLIPPVAVNGARLVMHQAADADYGPRAIPLGPSAQQALRDRQSVLSLLLRADLALAAELGWGPYYARAWAARALVARLRGDAAGEETALAVAASAAPWDNTLALRLGEVRLALGDRAGAAEAWRRAGLIDPLLERARQAGPAAALEWLALAQSVDPGDWRPYAEASQVLARSGQSGQAAFLLAEALRVRGADPVRQALADRLLVPGAELPWDVAPPMSRVDADLFARVSAFLSDRQDLAGAVYAAQMAVRADPDTAAHWRRLAAIWQGLGQMALAEEALARARSLDR